MLSHRLKHVVAVGRFGSFSRAADALGVTQSTVTKCVADLERSLGYPLFHRTSRGATPTEQGREFIDRAARVLADVTDLLGEADKHADPYRGTLRVGLFPGSIEWLLTDSLVALIKRHPQIRIETVSGSSERGIQLLARGDIDVAFGLHAAFSGWNQFKSEMIASAEIAPFVRIGHPLLLREQVGEEELVQYDFVVPSMSEPYTSIIQDMYERHGERIKDRLHMTDDFHLTRRIVGMSDAIGLVAGDYAQAPYFRERFAVLTDTKILGKLTVCYAIRVRWSIKPTVRALISLMRQANKGRA